MSKTTILAISIILLSAVVWILHFAQDQEIEELRSNVKDLQSEVYEDWYKVKIDWEEPLTQQDYEDLFEEGELK